MKIFINIIGAIAIASWLYFYYVLFTMHSDNALILVAMCLLMTGVHSLLYKRYLNDKQWHK